MTKIKVWKDSRENAWVVTCPTFRGDGFSIGFTSWEGALTYALKHAGSSRVTTLARPVTRLRQTRPRNWRSR